MKAATLVAVFLLGILYIAGDYAADIYRTEALVRIQLIDKSYQCNQTPSL